MNSPTLVNVYRIRVPNAKYIFKDGTVAQFVGDRFSTTVPKEIAELDAEVAAKHPTIYVVAGQEQMDPSDLDPELAYRKRIIAEYLAGVMDASGNPKRDMGKSEQRQIVPASSLSIAPIAAGAGVNTFHLPAQLQAALAQQQPKQDIVPEASPAAQALGLLVPQADSATHVPAGATAVDPDVLASMKLLDAFNG